MACTVEKILSIARAEVGVKEYPSGSNNVKYNTDYYDRVINDSEYAWCAVFVWWVFKESGFVEAVLRDGVKTASCPYLVTTFKLKGQWITGGYKPGDVIFFRWGSSGYDHVGIIESVNSDGSLVTIEGNTSITSDDNGGSVMRRNRPLTYVVGAGRPAYSDTVVVTPNDSISTYTVKSGDTLSGIALSQLHDASRYPEIKALNGLTSNTIYVGQTLKIPGKATSATPAPVETPPPVVAPAPVIDYSGTYKVTAVSGLNVRSGAGTGYSKIGALNYNTTVTVIGKSGDWYKIVYGSGYGYCSEDYLERSTSAVVTPIIENYKVTATSGLNIRSGAGTGYNKVGAIPYNGVVKVTDKSGSWYKVSYNGVVGWSSADYLKRV